MKKIGLLVAFLVVLALAFPTLSLAGPVLTVTFGGVACGANGICSSAPMGPGSESVDFNTGLPGSPTYTLAGGAGLVTGSVPLMFSEPTGDMTQYITTGKGTITITGLPVNDVYYGLYWGSVDKYNTIVITPSVGPPITFTGAQIAAMAGIKANGSTSIYVNFMLSGASIDSILLESSDFAFESDNQKFATPIPITEPATLCILGGGLFAFGTRLRRKVAAS
jgi:hypothetical protein